MLSNVVFDALLHGQSIQSVEIERSKTKSFLKFPTVVSKFGKNKDNLCLHKCLKGSTENIFGIYVQFHIKFRLVDPKIT